MYLSKVDKKRIFFPPKMKIITFQKKNSIENWVGKTKRRCSSLNVMSSEMDPAEIKLICKLWQKREAEMRPFHHPLRAL